METKSKVLVVDDEVGPREAMRMILKNRYDVVTAENGEEALEYMNNTEFDVAFVDIKMAGIDGIELLQKMKERRQDIEVILMTAYASLHTAKKALRHGAIEYLIKPFDHRDVLEVVEKGINKRRAYLNTIHEIRKLYITTRELSREVEEAKRSIEHHYASTVKALLAAIDAKDQYTRGHSERVSRFSVFLAEKIGIPQNKLSALEQAALIHDIGKIGIEENILRKKGTLDSSELEEIKKHPLIGARIIDSVEFLKEMMPVILYHHERFDGMGFPEGLKGHAIPWNARVVAIADAVDAMLCDRPYRSALTLEHVKRELSVTAGRQFDPDMISTLIKEGLLEYYSAVLT